MTGFEQDQATLLRNLEALAPASPPAAPAGPEEQAFLGAPVFSSPEWLAYAGMVGPALVEAEQAKVAPIEEYAAEIWWPGHAAAADAAVGRVRAAASPEAARVNMLSVALGNVRAACSAQGSAGTSPKAYIEQWSPESAVGEVLPGGAVAAEGEDPQWVAMFAYREVLAAGVERFCP